MAHWRMIDYRTFGICVTRANARIHTTHIDAGLIE